MIPAHTAPPSVAVVGGGAIGLACAWRLLERGARVAVYDRDAAPAGAPGASWASAGLLAATAGHGGPAGSPLDALCRLGLDRWPAFARALEGATGIDVALREEGTLVVALTDAETAHLRAAFDAWHRAGDRAQRWLSRAEAAAREPALVESVVAARWCPHDTQVDSRRLVAALAAAVRSAGATIHERAEVETLDAIDADVVVLAAGAWSGRLAGRRSGEPRLAVRPVKGQMIAFRDDAGTPPLAPPLRHVVFTTSVYLVPRPGRLLVGATVEETGFEAAVTDAATDHLRRAAGAALPPLTRAEPADAWAGLRPVTPDGAPLLGWLDDRTIVATGHGRNGILLTPITADVVARLAFGERVDGLEPFAVDRFAGTSRE